MELVERLEYFRNGAKATSVAAVTTEGQQTEKRPSADLQQLIDQSLKLLLHCLDTYGYGWFSKPQTNNIVMTLL